MQYTLVVLMPLLMVVAFVAISVEDAFADLATHPRENSPRRSLRIKSRAGLESERLFNFV